MIEKHSGRHPTPTATQRAARGAATSPAQARPHPLRSGTLQGPTRRRRPAAWRASLSTQLLFARHSALLVHGRLLRWRLETFGLYAPSLPGARPWWRVNGRMALLLLRRRSHYAGWLAEMRALRCRGAAGWWQETNAGTARALHAYIEQANRDGDGAP